MRSPVAVDRVAGAVHALLAPGAGHSDALGLGQGAAAQRLRPARRCLGARQSDRVIDVLAGKLPTVAGHLDTARADILACTKIKDATLTGSIART